MSEKTNSEETEEIQKQPAKSPLQILKERQAQQRQNLAAKGRGSTPAAPQDQSASGQTTSQKKMRSSASKQGG